jgi:hypothetical protein
MSHEAYSSSRVTVFYEKDKDYRLLPVTGAFGGPTPSGDILAEFFVERRTAPEKIVMEISGGTANEISREGERHVRELVVGLLIRPDVAHSIGLWLIEKAKQFGVGETRQ